MFGHDWEPASAKIVDVRDRAVRVENAPAQEYSADVTPDSGAPPFRALIEQPIMDQDFVQPWLGLVVRVHADVKRQKAKFDTSDPQLSYQAQKKHKDDSFEAGLEQAPGTPTPD
jgi:hypothetical protein